MNLLRFLRSAPSANWVTIVVMSSIAGFAGGAVLALINLGATAEGAETPPSVSRTQLVVLFIITILIYVVAKQYSATRTAAILEQLVTEFRLRVCEKLRRAELEVVESLNRSEVFSTVTQESSRIAQSGFLATNLAQQALTLVVGSVYLAYLSPVAFCLFAIGSAVSVWKIVNHREALIAIIRKDAQKQAELFSYLDHLLSGFKETKLSQTKGDAILLGMTKIASESRDLRLQTSRFFVNSSILADLTLYLLLGSAVFVLPEIIPTYADVIVKASLAILFVFAPLATVVSGLPQLTEVDHAIERLFRLERQLDETSGPIDDAEAVRMPSFADFRAIRLRGVIYTYPKVDESEAFSVGPIDLEIRRGEVNFLVGGNGSGKTTLMKLVAGLYEPKSGEILVDEVVVTRRLRPAYRELFAGVFSDFHLFDTLYGIEQVDAEAVADLLERMQIAHKVTVRNGRFSTLNLSTGQRKRLALVASLLEDRPVYLFDEWTADQDPRFRKEFYETILRGMKRDGKTVIAITHDDRYWPVADHKFELDYGRIVVENATDTVPAV